MIISPLMSFRKGDLVGIDTRRRMALTVILESMNSSYVVSRRTGRDIWNILKREPGDFLEVLFPSSRMTDLNQYSPEIEEILYGPDYLKSMEDSAVFNVRHLSFLTRDTEYVLSQKKIAVFQKIGGELK